MYLERKISKKHKQFDYSRKKNTGQIISVSVFKKETYVNPFASSPWAAAKKTCVTI